MCSRDAEDPNGTFSSRGVCYKANVMCGILVGLSRLFKVAIRGAHRDSSTYCKTVGARLFHCILSVRRREFGLSSSRWKHDASTSKHSQSKVIQQSRAVDHVKLLCRPDVTKFQVVAEMKMKLDVLLHLSKISHECLQFLLAKASDNTFLSGRFQFTQCKWSSCP